MLATIAGTDDWEAFWRDLVANDVAVTSGWEDAYYGDFVAGGGDRSLVVSYASSPPAEVVFADPPVDAAPTGVVPDGEVVRTGGAALDPPGYDLRGAIVGGEGTLGVVTEITNKLSSGDVLHDSDPRMAFRTASLVPGGGS